MPRCAGTSFRFVKVKSLEIFCPRHSKTRGEIRHSVSESQVVQCSENAHGYPKCLDSCSLFLLYQSGVWT